MFDNRDFGHVYVVFINISPTQHTILCSICTNAAYSLLSFHLRSVVYHMLITH